jgi:hypothetical protein
MSEARIVWASDAATKAARHISEVRTGLACNCVCPGCAARLEAVNAENPLWKRRPHFRHHQAPELEDCALQAVLAGAREALKQASEIQLPEVRAKRIVAAQDHMKFSAEAVQPEQQLAVAAVELVDATDAILQLTGGERIYVRLVATAKRPDDIKQTLLSEVLIDISDPVLRTADPETLRQHITLGVRAKHWCNHLREPDLIAEADAAARLKASRYWEDRIAQREAEERARRHAEDLMSSQQLQIHHPARPHAEPVKSITRIAPAVTPPKPRHTGPVEYVWARMAPQPSLAANVVIRNKQIWPNWDWRAIMDLGESFRSRDIPVDAALQEALERFRFSPTNNVVRNAWFQAGILCRMPRSSSMNEEKIMTDY